MKHDSWNEGWQFTPVWDDALLWPGPCPVQTEPVRIPHTVCQLPYNYCNEESYQLLSGYRRSFTVPESWRGKRVVLRFGAVAHCATVYCNGQQICEHRCGYTAFQADLTPALRYGEENVVAVKCDSRESLNVPPFGKVIDYLTYGGIYRAVTLQLQEPVSISDLFLTAGAEGNFRLYPTMHGDPTGCTLKMCITDGCGSGMGMFSAPAGQPLCGTVGGVTPWTPDTPVLYHCCVRLVRDSDGKVLDTRTLKAGFRTIEFKADGLYLNGHLTPILGLNRHQSWAYQGYAMPDSQQRLDAKLLKELGCNAVRTSHYPQSHAFLDACDELGLLVFTEIPGWQYVGDSAWKDQAVQNCREMVLEYRNHPSIFLWGVRINESKDDDIFYKRTNAVVHQLDPTRPTGGVRNIKNSRFFEDVYTYNDFYHNGTNAGCEPRRNVTTNMAKGYLITEYCGHMFPTKSFDWEGKRLEHALRYSRVASDAAAQKGIAGSFGWCMFDYNTHKDFGSGDRICYHGVLDMFRNPKLTAAVYASQKKITTKQDVVLEISSGMDIGDHPGGGLGDIWAFTNADSVRLFKNDTYIAEFFPNRKGTYAGLAHPPICIDDTIGSLLETNEGFSPSEAKLAKECLRGVQKYGPGNLPPVLMAKMGALMLRHHLSMEQATALYGKYVANWGGTAVRYRFEAIVNGQVVKTVIKEPVECVRLEAHALNPILTDGPTWDCAAIQLRAVDQNGNVLPYCGDAVRIETTGPVQIIGPDVVSLRGGMAGTYLATIGQAGIATVKCTLPGAEPVVLPLEIRLGE